MYGKMMAEGDEDMHRISEWFDRHPKTRIALQLVLDGLPFLMAMFSFNIGLLELDMVLSYPGWWDTIAIGCMYVIMYGGGAVLFVLGIWLRSRAAVEFECYPWCKAASIMLRVLSFLPAILSFGFLIGITVLYLRNL